MNLATSVYNKLIVQKLDKDVTNVIYQRGYLKPELGSYFAKNNILLFPEQDLSLEEIMTLSEVGWVSDATNFTLQNRVVVPIKNAVGNIVTLVGWRKGASKYLTIPSQNFSKEACWFNINNALIKSFEKKAVRPSFYGRCVVVEGIFDALVLDALGVPAIATMGSDVSFYKGELLNIFDKVLCMPDNDKVGQRALDTWSVPRNASFLYFNPTTFKLSDDLVVTVKDVDNLVNYYDTETVLDMLEYHLDNPSRVTYLDL